MTELREMVARVRFGDVVENGWASEDNPTRRGFFVREFVRTGRLNPGRTWELTDGCGKFWEFKPSDIGERLTVTSASLNLIGGDGWRPIETAPKDGTSVLLCSSGPETAAQTEPHVGYHYRGGGWMDFGSHGCAGPVAREPTHWRPIQPPPASS